MESQPPVKTLRKRAKAVIHQITGCVSRLSGNTKTSEVAYVNRYWDDPARRMFYRQITLTRLDQLHLLLKAVDLVPPIRSHIIQLSVSRELLTHVMQQQRRLSSELLFAPREEERLDHEKFVVTTLLDLLSKLTSLDSVTIHADYMQPIFNVQDDTIKSPDLGTLTAIRQLRIVDLGAANGSPGSQTDTPNLHLNDLPSP
ncbi:hypothetical protein FRC01_003371, partial [Tulasnella sp. 417]